MKMRVTKSFCFEMAHALSGHDGPCKNIHGHSYRLSVTVAGKVNSDKGSSKSGMVIDFADLKSIVDRLILKKYDHALVLQEEYVRQHLPEMKPGFENVIKVAWQPTCENMALEFATALHNELPGGLKLHHLKLRETPTSYAEWYSEDNK